MSEPQSIGEILAKLGEGDITDTETIVSNLTREVGEEPTRRAA